MKAHIWFSVLFPGSNCKQNSRYSCRYFKMGKQIKFFRIGWLEILRELLFNLDLHKTPPYHQAQDLLFISNKNVDLKRTIQKSPYIHHSGVSSLRVAIL